MGNPAEHLAKYRYSKELRKSAEDFMKKIFSSDKLAMGTDRAVIEAAMNIINGVHFCQPTLPFSTPVKQPND